MKRFRRMSWSSSGMVLGGPCSKKRMLAILVMSMNVWKRLLSWDKAGWICKFSSFLLSFSFSNSCLFSSLDALDSREKEAGKLIVLSLTFWSMVNNAGIGVEGERKRIHEVEEEEWDLMMYVPPTHSTFLSIHSRIWFAKSHFSGISNENEPHHLELNRKVNVRGVFLGCKFACAQFLKQELDSSGHRGWIVNTASILGLAGCAGGVGESYWISHSGGIILRNRQNLEERGFLK